MDSASGLIELDVERCLQELEDLSPGARFQVSGEVGAGKTMLSRILGEKRNAVVVEPPELSEDDAVAHALLQASRKAGVPVDGELSTSKNVKSMASALAKSRRPVVLRLPVSWRLDQKPRHAHQQRLLEAARGFVETWFEEPDISIVLVADRPRGMPKTKKRIWMAKGRAQPEMLEQRKRWGTYSTAAEDLRRVIGDRWNGPSPVSLRLAVGLVALGESPNTVGKLLLEGRPPGYFTREIVRKALAGNLAPVLQRFATIRTAVPVDWIADVTRCPQKHLPLLTQCLGYGDEQVRLSRSVRDALQYHLRDLQRGQEHPEATHRALAARYKTLDGAVDPSKVGDASIVFWLEKVHHLAHGGDECADEWSQQVLELRDHLCERARVLSHDHHDYVGAAALYRKIVDQFDDQDAYAWHYLGYNLDMAASDRRGAEDAYRRATVLDPENPWWNSRYVTFLVGQARFRDADAAWERAMDDIDPDGVETEENPELAQHLHRWVAKAWLDHGEVERARKVIDRVLGPGLQLEGVWEVVHRIEDAEEALSLGASVRPPDMPVSERWTPAVLPPDDDLGESRSRWYAGRIEEVAEDGVHVVFATTESEEQERRLLRKTMPLDEWKVVTNIEAQSSVGTFIEIGEYGERVLIFPVASYRRIQHIDERELRYLKRWPAE